MNQPTQQQISEARAYIRSRVEAELSMKSNLEALLRKASLRLANLAKEYGLSVRAAIGSTSPAIRLRIRQIIDWLMAMIEDYVDTLSVASHKEDKDMILAYVKREQYGRTFNERLTGYVNDFIYGTDTKRSPSKALSVLTTYAVTEGWMRWWGINGERKESKGFYSYRGSNYPCSLCDSMTGYHPMSEYMGAWHPHCRCYFIFV